MDPDELNRFLVSLPSRLGFADHEALEKCIYKALYYAATAEGKYLRYMFPLIIQDQIDELHKYEFPLSLHDRRPFYTVKSPVKYTHPKDKVCARTFKKGEAVYQCQDCSFDETCVLCSFCFNPKDHQNHSVFSYYSPGTSSGMCDCGDPEAFKVPLNCKCQSNPLESEELPPDFQKSLYDTIQICLDYILDVTNFSIQTLPFIHEHINTPGSPLTSLRLSNYSSLPSGRYGGAVDTNSMNLWYLVLWNDEHHTIEEATQAILAATDLAKPRAQALTQVISEAGKAIILERASYSELLVPLRNAQINGLVATICSARDYMKESMVESVWSWLQSMAEFEGNSQVSSLFGGFLTKLLLKPNHQLSKVVPAEFIKGLSIDDKRRCFENGLLYDGNFVNDGLCEVSPYDNISQLYKPAHLILKKSSKLDRLQRSRLQYLLAFEIRFSTKLRGNFGNFLVSHLIGDTNTKITFSDQFLELYPQLITTMCLSDREEELNCMSCISSQLFTCPATILHVLDSDKLRMIIGPLARLIEEHSARWNFDSGYPNLVDITEDKPSIFRSIVLAIQRGIDDIRHITDKTVNSSLANFLTPNNIIFLLTLIRNFQGYWPVERKYGDHVEMERMDFFVHRLYTTPILDIVRALSLADADIKAVQEVVKLLVDFLLVRQVKKNAPGIPDFVVSKEPVSFINPINTFLSYLIQNHGYQNFEHILNDLKLPFVNISDISLRSIVLAAQVNIGFWIRNGFSVSRQASLYANSTISDWTYHRDFHLNQIAAILDDPRVTLYNYLERWELLDWYVSKVDHSQTVYEDRFGAIAEKFIIFLYNLVTDRSRFEYLNRDDLLMRLTRQEICYALCDGPKSYSYLESFVTTNVSEYEKFDSILSDCAEFQPPTGLTDAGRYKLKASMLEYLDPMSISVEGSKYQDVQDALVKQISKSKGIKEDEVVLIPKYTSSGNTFVDTRISRFTKTTDFAKLIYKLMRTSIDTSNEFYILHALHLLHAVIIDDEQLVGPDYLNQSFVSIPIGDLLMTLVKSTQSPQVKHKAEHLLGIFMERDDLVIESLVDCFGKEYVTQYREDKKESFTTDKNKKRSLAEKRKAKVMKKFAKQRKQFLEGQGYDNGMVAQDESEELSRKCILCGEPESIVETFGILASNTETSVFWKLPEEGQLIQDAFESFDEIIDRTVSTYSYGYHYSKNASKLNNGKESKLVFSTCGHGMHYKCFKQSSNRSLHINCPLCKSYQNTFIPTYISPSKVVISDEIMTESPKHLSYNEILESHTYEKVKLLLTSFLSEEYFEEFSHDHLRQIVDEGLMAHVKAHRSYSFELDRGNSLGRSSLNKMSDVISDTLRMQEIATRIEGDQAFTELLKMIPQLSKHLIRSLVQSRLYLGVLGSLDNDASVHYSESSELDDMTDSAFNEMVRLFFGTGESFQTLSRLGLLKTFSLVACSLVHRILDGKITVPTFERHLEDETVKNMRLLLHGLCEASSLSRLDLKDDGFVASLYFTLERCVLPYLRQVLLFMDILTIEYDTPSSSWVSSLKIESLMEQLSLETHVDSTDAMCDFIKVPRLKEILKLLVERPAGSQFETRIYDNIICAKIPKYFDEGILTIEYPGVVKLIDLPDEFSSFMFDEEDDDFELRDRDTLICLACGTNVGTEKQQLHIRDCCRQVVYFQPRLNFLRISTRIGKVPIGFGLPAPYLTEHGEVKRARMRGKAKLNHLRYRYLNKLWLNLGLYGYMTRTMTENDLDLATLDTFDTAREIEEIFPRVLG